ncbi:organic cation transporter protein-like [Physella acuta]|uniref:organic cation transporter protein-like n=1 Tax=Physella acuta TaxID=109671 RepID=UPI0027DCB1F6|nr:organic cation transporter protein-like [Physella acuta]
MAENDHVGTVLDNVLLSLGWLGRYQRIQFALAMMPCISSAFHTMSVVFIGRPVTHRCANISNELTRDDAGFPEIFTTMSSTFNTSIQYGACSIDLMNGTSVVHSEGCHGRYEYDEPSDRSFVSQWDLVCDGESLSDVSQTVLSCGQMFGALFLTGLADVFGRKPMFMLTHLLLLSVAIGIAFSPNFLVFVALRFFLGAVEQGTVLIANVVLMELMPIRHRALPSQFCSYLWAVALLMLCLCAYVTKDVSWRYAELLLAVSSLPVLIQWWVTDETLRWLLANNKFSRAKAILVKAAKVNRADVTKTLAILTAGTSMTSFDCSDTKFSSETQDTKALKCDDCPTNMTTSGSETTNQKKEMRFLAFVKNRNVLMVTVISCYIWFADSAVYYGLLMTSSSLADDLYLGFLLSVLVELPAAFAFSFLVNVVGSVGLPFAFAFLVNVLGRKRCASYSHLLAAFSLMAVVLLSYIPGTDSIPGLYWIQLTISLIGKFGITTGFSTMYLYSPELYPTNLRNTGFGISSLAARVGGMVAPYSRTFERHVAWGPGAVFSLLCLLVPVVIQFLPETNGHELPQTVQEMDEWLKKPKDRNTENTI